ncbi:MAG TPA: T9SS type A sorting domain-containing protein [Ignavibacteria bacterium]|nr:T9SS type A sorting domain-containing protein [Ignavibacteria bacterium]HMQ98713.1 T9SS type A sorting domain-containing protein [Ignavibacteria bacterium]
MKKSYSILFFISISFLLANSSELFSQPNTIWAKIYNGPVNQQDSAVGVCLNSAGNVFVTGWSLGSGTAADIVTLRYDPETGDTIWVNRYNGASNLEEKVSAITCDNNAVYVTGWSVDPNRDILTIKYDAATGSRLWVKKFNGAGNGGDYGFAIAVNAAGEVYVTGRSDAGGGMGQKYTTIKYDASGNVVAGWPSVYIGPLSSAFDQAQAIKLDASGNAYVTGKSGTAGTENFLTMKINNDGTVAWAKKYNGTQNSEDNALALVLDNGANNVYVGGYSFRTGAVQDYMTIKYNASTGDSLAAASYNGPLGSTDQLTAMAIDNSNNVYVTGYSAAVSTGYDYATIKYNSNLSQQWLQRTSNSGSDFPFFITVDNASGFVFVTGSSFGSGTGYDYLTISYTSSGAFNWEKRENSSSSGNDYASGIAVQDTDRIFVTGSANFSGTGIAFYTLRYSKISAIDPISSNIPSKFTLSQNYPNPFNPITSIRFDIPKASFVQVTVYDVMGREIENLVKEQLKAGEYMVKWDAIRFSSGIYFYSITADGFRSTKKMILTK